MKRSSLKSLRSQKGFTLVELIVVIAVLGILSLILVPQFSLYGDKAMGTAALSDARSILSIAISHNMDNVNAITQKDLARYMGLSTVSGGGTGDPDTDASGSKKMTVNGNTITYEYTRGGLTLTCKIDVGAQSRTWEVLGLGQPAMVAGNPNYNRYIALCEGLKIKDGDLTCT